MIAAESIFGGRSFLFFWLFKEEKNDKNFSGPFKAPSRMKEDGALAIGYAR